MTKKTLEYYVEEISDDFQSTFSVLAPNVLSNMMGLKGDFKEVSDIIKKYIPKMEVTFTKTYTLSNTYDIYIIEGKHND